MQTTYWIIRKLSMNQSTPQQLHVLVDLTNLVFINANQVEVEKAPSGIQLNDQCRFGLPISSTSVSSHTDTLVALN